MKILKKIIEYLFNPCITEVQSKGTNKLSVYMYRNKVMVGTSDWKMPLTKAQSNDIWSMIFTSSDDAASLANRYYYENCNNFISC